MTRAWRAAVACCAGLLAGAAADGAAPERTSFPGASGKIAFVGSHGRSAQIYVVNPDGSGRASLPGGRGGADPSWSPDGSRLAFGTRGGIRVMNADGSGSLTVTRRRNDRDPA